MAAHRVLQLLAQRPGLTGSGVTVDALSRELLAGGHEVDLVVGVPAEESAATASLVLADAHVHPLRFGAGGELPFPVPGMSDVMPYRSTVFSAMDDAQWGAYRDAWREHLARVLERVQPDVVHAHHVWLLSSLVKDVAPELPLLVHCHATGLRQLRLCPERAEEVVTGVRRADAFAALHEGHRDALVDALGIDGEQVHVVGAGYDERVFHARSRAAEPGRVTYAGKLSLAKGVQPLLDAFEALVAQRPQARLTLAGEGAGEEARSLVERIAALPWAEAPGRLRPVDLSDLLRRTAVFVLPSFYEGLPLVLAEARACGCRLVATALPGVEGLANELGGELELVEMPPLLGVDHPDPAALPEFTGRLERALRRSLDAPPLPVDPVTLAPFTWRAVCARVVALYDRLTAA